MRNNIKFFFYGIISALGAMIIELVLKNILSSEISLGNIFFTIITPSLILFALVEETLKFIVINKAVLSLKKSSEAFIGAFLIGLGFALTEIYLAFSNNLFEQSNYLLAILGILIIHISTSLIFGYFSFKKNPLSKTFFTVILIFATLLHLIYNIFIIYKLSPAIVLAYLFLLLLLSFSVSYLLAKRENMP